jgi:hypothetical protein
MGNIRADYIHRLAHLSVRKLGSLCTAIVPAIRGTPGLARIRAGKDRHTVEVVMRGTNRLGQAIWLILAIAACWVFYLAASSYGSCRATGSGKLGCFIGALLITAFETLIFAVATVVKLLRLVLP